MKSVVVTGATGHVGKELCERLLGRGLKVRVLGRTEDRLRALASQGAEPRVGSVDDALFMASVFEGAAGAFLMIPPSYAAPDIRAAQRRTVESYATALSRMRIPVVTLSSVGAEKAAGTGPILGLHELEARCNAIDGLHVVHLRASYFLENHLWSIGTIKALGKNGGTIRGDVALPMVATRDIAAIAADLLARGDFTGRSHRYVLGARDYSHVEATRILGAAIDRPELEYVQFPEEAARQAMLGMGMSANAVDAMLEMNRGLSAGTIGPVERRNEASTTPTTLEEFARTVFAPAYRAS